MEWTDAKEDLLIDFWQQHPCLYDVGSKSYSNRYEKNKVTNEIADTLSTTAFHITKRLLSLRTQFARLIKPLPSGSGFVTKTTRQKWLIEKLDFLRIHVKCDTLTNLSREDNSSVDGDISISSQLDNSQMEDDSETASHSVFHESTGLEDDDLECDRPVRSTKRPIEKSTAVIHAKKSKRDTEMNMIRSLIDVVAQPEKKEGPDDKYSNDEDAIFGQYIVTELRKVVDPTVKLMLKNSIINTVFKARMGSAAPQTASVSFYQQCIPDQCNAKQLSSCHQHPYNQEEFNKDMRFQQQSTSFRNSMNEAQKLQSEVHHQSYNQEEFNQDMRFQQQSISFQNSINQTQKLQSEVHPQSYNQEVFNQGMRFQQQSTSFQNSFAINQAQKPQSEVHHQNIPGQFGDYSFSQLICVAEPSPTDTFLQPI